MDVLAALEQLEAQNKKPTNTKFVNPLGNNNNNRRSRSQGPGRPTSRAQSRPTNRVQSRPTSRQSNGGASRPQSRSSPTHLAPSIKIQTTSSDSERPERSPSVSSTRRISFAEPPPPPSTRRRIRLITKTSSLFSGFIFDPKELVKYNVTEEEWKDFGEAVIDAIQLPKRAKVLWPLYRSEAAKKVKRELQYEQSNLKRLLNAWNRMFKRKGFTAYLEVPGPVRIADTASVEDKELAKKEAKFFRMVITPAADKGTSIYSRASSLTRSVRGEGAVAANGREEFERVEKEEREGSGAEEDKEENVADKMESLKVNQIEATDQVANKSAAVAA